MKNRINFLQFAVIVFFNLNNAIILQTLESLNLQN